MLSGISNAMIAKSVADSSGMRSKTKAEEIKMSFDKKAETISEFTANRKSTIGTVILWGWAIAGILAVTIVVAVTVISIWGKGEVPDVLSNWGGVIIGFYFGQFFSLIKDYMAEKSEYEGPTNLQR